MSTTAESSEGLRIVGWCHWCQNAADNVRVIQVDEQGSGRGGVRYACGPCREEHHLVPLAEREERETAQPPTEPGHGGRQIIMAGMFPTMTTAQREGRACPWCNTEVTPETGIDLGERHLDRAGVAIHPYACRPCTNREARKSFAHHCRMCSLCKRGEYCPDKRPLHRLAVETRR